MEMVEVPLTSFLEFERRLKRLNAMWETLVNFKKKESSIVDDAIKKLDEGAEGPIIEEVKD